MVSPGLMGHTSAALESGRASARANGRSRHSAVHRPVRERVPPVAVGVGAVRFGGDRRGVLGDCGVQLRAGRVRESRPRWPAGRPGWSSSARVKSATASSTWPAYSSRAASLDEGPRRLLVNDGIRRGASQRVPVRGDVRGRRSEQQTGVVRWSPGTVVGLPLASLRPCRRRCRATGPAAGAVLGTSSRVTSVVSWSRRGALRWPQRARQPRERPPSRKRAQMGARDAAAPSAPGRRASFSEQGVPATAVKPSMRSAASSASMRRN